MTTTLRDPPMPTARPPVPNSFEIGNASWDLYELLVRDLAGQHVSVTYDNGRLALMSPLPVYEIVKKVIGAMVEMTAVERRVPFRPLGSTTWRRKDLAKGLEADECYYFQHAEQLGNRKDIDLSTDPPPDLVVEVDIRRHPMDRPAIYAALGVNELWRYDGAAVEFLKRSADGRYGRIDRSEALPILTVGVINRHLDMLETSMEWRVLQAFKDWLRSLPAAG